MGHIYLITNNIDGKTYIGKTKKSIEERFRKHMYDSRYNKTSYLHKAIKKYGIENFSIKSIEDVVDSELNEREIFWIKNFDPCYNMTKGGDGGTTTFITEEYRAWCSKRYSGAGNPMYGKRGPLNPSFGKKRTNNRKSDKKKNPCVCEGKQFSSIGDAEAFFKENGIRVSVRKRIDNPKYESWYRLKNKTLKPRNHSKICL